ncbi:outer membrane protein [Microvirga makkahensis]|uniref:Outer membrane beta-barrel protein n=1 Tax=Microvirga makkahensis TaxID=1128670 RepID=A0A7X3SQL1_9HYPH|nr:outer membrane beta-barrel protein [Microvirga makkahensis]MXQ13204.1 outer membrane beta-barrel protein [Microvirga makkahensis]
MKKYLSILLAGVAGAALAAATASAADLPVREAPPAPIIAAAPIFTWTGFYAGVNAGWGWRSDDDETVVLGGAVPGTLFFENGDDGGFVGGGQIGYNYQIGSFVVGLEADIQWADTDDGEEVRFVPAGAPGTFVPGEFENNLSDWFGTVRARAGVAFDRVLIYGTGGLAYTDDNTGWALGGGVEWALPVNWFGSSAVTFGIEGLWLSFDEDDDDDDGFVGTFTPDAGGPPIDVFAPGAGSDDNDFFVARAKLNFKFGTY